MKKNLLMKMIPLLLGILFQVTSVWGQLLVENFDYTIGTNITSNGWVAHSSGGTQPITVTNGLIYTGYVGSDIGGAALLDNTGEDDHRTFDVQTSGIVYSAFMVKVTTTAAGYFLHLGGSPIGTTFRGKVFLDATNHFGLSMGSNTATSASLTYNLGQTYFLVLKYEIVAGANNDKVSLFVFDGTFPTEEPVTATIGPLTDAAMTDINPASIALRQHTASQNITVDGIRVANNWADAATPAGGPATMATPTFSPPPGNVLEPFDLTILCATEDADIYYTTDGTDPNQGSSLFSIPINIYQTTMIKARAYLNGYEPSSIATAVYTFPSVVNTVAELRASVAGTGVVYHLTAEVFLTYQQEWRNQKFVQDATAGILIDDLSGIIISDYEIGDGFTGLLGTIANYNTMLQFTPIADPGDPTSAGNIITPTIITLAELTANFENYESELITIENATFADGGVNFAPGTVYPITDVSDATFNFRTAFYDADYLYTAIPISPCNLTGIPNAYSNANYFTSRFATDIVETIVTPTIIVTSPNGYEYWEQGSTHNVTWGNINFTGNVKISLIRGFNTTVLVTDLANTGSWAWQIPIDQTLSGNYKIKIQGVNTGDPSDTSDDFFSIIAPLPDPVIVINEIMYNPSTVQGLDDYYEYFELFNNSGFDVYLDNWYFSAGITHTFAPGTMIPDGGYLAVVRNADTIADFYGITNVVQWTSGALNNGGELIELKDPEGNTMDAVSYLNIAPWPTSPDGTGSSLELLDPALDNSLAENWAASAVNFGTPGIQNSVAGLEILTVTSPNGGEVFEQGSSQTITWTHTNFTGSIKIELITSAKGREILAENIPVTDLLWDWEIPADFTVGANYKIKISDQADGSPVDESDGVFSIVGVIVPSISVTSPNGGESWEQGSSHSITWTAVSFTGNVKIELSNGTTTVQLADAIAATAGTWLWNIPVDQEGGSNYTIIVTGMNTGDPNDMSDAPFSIVAPVGIPNIVINEIMYNSIEATDNEWIELLNMESVTIDLTGYVIKDNSNTHTVIFPAGHSIAPGQYFTVAIKIGSPPMFFTPDWNANASWGLDNSTDQVRLFNASGAIVDSVQYSDIAPWPTSPDGTGPSLELLDPTLDNSLPESWLGSLATNGTPKTQNSVYQYESVTVTFPNGGEIFEQGSSQSITWTYVGFAGNLKIELITAADSREILAENVPVTDGVWDWEVPADQPVGTNFKIKISDMVDGSPMDESNGVFSIASVIVPSLTVISPNGGEEWVQGTTHNIEWSTSYFTGLVKIQLFDGSSITTLAESLAADGSPFIWNIPSDQPEGYEYTVLISGMNPEDPFDMSDAPFSIVAPAPLPNLVINEINYNNPGNDNEWIEIYNNDIYTVDLEGFYIQDNNDLATKVTFPAGYSIAPGQYFTVSLELLAPPLPFTPDFVGNPQPSWSLGNTSDAVRIFNPGGMLVDIVTYFDSSPWPTAPDGSGPTLSLLDPNLDNNVGESWAASPVNGGTPGSENFPPTPMLTVISPNGGETIQQGTTFNIAWYSQNFVGDIKIELVDTGTSLTELLFASLPHDQGNVDWSVTQAAGSAYLIRISDVLDGDPMDESDLVFSIVEPAGLPQIVINEIMYNPPETGTDVLEYIELYNNDDIAVDLAGWSFTQGIDFVFPTYILEPGNYLVVALNSTAMLNSFGITALQWTSGGLSNSGEDIELRNATNEVIDYVDFDDASPWPIAPDEYGPSLSLLDPSLDNSLAANWAPETKLGLVLTAYNIFASPGTINFPEPAQSYLIALGWSGISSYTAAAVPYVAPLMSLVESDLIVMQDFSNIYYPIYGINTIDVWMNNTGYQLKMNKSRYHVIWGPKISGSEILLSAGWNSISVLSECPVSATDLFGSLSNIIFVKEMGSEKIYWPDGSIFTLDYLMPGYAYYVKAGAETIITFPACTSKANYIQPTDKKSNLTSWNDVVNTSSSHTIGFTASALSMLKNGDVIGAFTSEGYCAGMVTVDDGNVAMMAWGNDTYTTAKDGLNENEPIHFRVYNPATGTQYAVVAEFDPSFTDGNTFVTNGISMVTSLKEGSIGIIEPVQDVASLYPNPANKNLTIKTGKDFDNFEIYSAVGQRVYSGVLSGNQNTVSVQSLQNGYYFVRLMNSINGSQTTLSFVKE